MSQERYRDIFFSGSESEDDSDRYGPVIIVDLSDNEGEVGGYDYEFTNEVSDNQKCSICLLTMRDAVQTNCGHRFCGPCLKRHVRTISKCPTCRADIDPRNGGIFDDVAWSRDILSLQVKCPESKKGCEWQKEVRHTKDHQEECPFVDVTCTDCQAVFERRHKDIHQEEECSHRIVQCAFCQLELPYYEKLIHEEEDCERFPLVCENECGLTKMPREEMEVHLRDVCPMTVVVCPYKKAGCMFTDKRANIDEHVGASSEDHIQLLLGKVLGLEEKVKNLEEVNKRKVVYVPKKCSPKRSNKTANWMPENRD